ncbi:hypothetical protein HYW55_00320 [Candidatus Gottesmanbacteria bacterium]|nr:hypothetical protein [Candidatus Gottesmanbacteria bacterium]
MRNFFANKISDFTIVLSLGILLMAILVIVWFRLFEATLTMYEGPRFAIYIQPKPNTSWLTYHDPDLEFSLRYPATHDVIPVAIGSEKNNYAYKILEFIPKDLSSQDGSVRLSSYYRGTYQDLSSWLEGNTSTSTGEEVAPLRRSFALYHVSTPSASTVSNKQVYTLGGISEYFQYPLEVTAFWSENYVYLISHKKGSPEFIYQPMLSSFEY